MSTEEHSVEVATTIYASLRNEILEKMRFSNQLLSYKLLSVGAIAGFVSANYQAQSFFVSAAIILALFLSFAFDLALFQNNKAIIAVGIYMKKHIEPWLKEISGCSTTMCMWEEYISYRVEGGERLQRKTYNIFEAVNYLITIAIIIIAIFYLYKFNFNKIAFVVSCFILLGEIIVTFKGLEKNK